METVVKSTQEQAVASWIGYLRELRINAAIEKLFAQDSNLEEALKELSNVKRLISEEIVGRNRGGLKGMHGFIAELSEVGIGNAQQFVQGQKANRIWINDNKAADISIDGVNYQLKFVKAGGHWGLESIQEHCSSYPNYVKEGNKYIIPKDFYESLRKLYDMPEDVAVKLGNEGQFTYRNWKWVHDFFEKIKDSNPDLDMTKIEPSLIEYADSQLGKYESRFDTATKQIKRTDTVIRKDIMEHTKPNIKEGTGATVVGALAEGGLSFCLVLTRKWKEGKRLPEFTNEDWEELGVESGKGTVKGAIRGAGIYTISNFTATPENIAAALMTAIFGISAQANALRKGKISNEEFLINSEAVCLDVTISAIASLIGKTLIPCNVLGAIIGNVAGMFMYEAAKTVCLENEQKLISHYRSEIEQLSTKLGDQYIKLIHQLEEEMKKYDSLIEMAFDPDVNKSFYGSIELAQNCGVAEEKILSDKSAIDAYFLS